MQTSYWYSFCSGLSISTPVVTSQFLSSQIKVIYVFSLSYPHSYQSISLLSKTPGNNSVLLKYATTHATADRGTAHELRPRLFPHFVVNSLPLRSNPTLFQVTSLLLRTSLTSGRYGGQEGDSCHGHMVASQRRDVRESGRIESFLFYFFLIESLTFVIF